MKKLYKIHTESNTIKRIMAYGIIEARVRAYQLFGSENFTIKKV